MLEDMGNAVKINDTIVPAINIQVDGVPGFLDNGQWYNPYFEILFEDGRLWVVEDRREDTPEHSDGLRRYLPYIVVEKYVNWYTKPELWIVQCFATWEEFLSNFNILRHCNWVGEDYE